MKPNKPFTTISDKILFDKRVSPSALKVYLLICQHAYGKKVVSFPSQDSLAFFSGFKRETVNRLIKQLVKLGYIKSERVGNQLNNEYVIELFTESEVNSFIKPIKQNCKLYIAEIRKERECSKNNKQSDVIFDPSDVTPESHQDVTSEAEVMCHHSHTNQYNKKHIQFEASQFVETDSDAPLRSASSSAKNADSVSQGTNSVENIISKETTTNSVPSEAPSKDSVKNLKVPSGFDELFEKPAQFVSSELPRFDSFEDYLEKKETMKERDILNNFPQYTEYVLNDLLKGGN